MDRMLTILLMPDNLVLILGALAAIAVAALAYGLRHRLAAAGRGMRRFGQRVSRRLALARIRLAAWRTIAWRRFKLWLELKTEQLKQVRERYQAARERREPNPNSNRNGSPPVDTPTPAPASGAKKKPGYQIDIRVPHDRQARRNKVFRWTAVATCSLGSIVAIMLVVGWLTSFATSSGAATVVLMGFSILPGAPLGIILLQRSFVYNPEWTAYVTQDAFSGDNIPYGPGLHPTLPWEERNAEGNYSLRVITVAFEIMVQTSTAQVKAKGVLQYMVDLSNINRFIGIDATTIEKGLIGFMQSFLTGEFADMTAEEARRAVRDINAKLCEEFMHMSMALEDGAVDTSTPADFEGKYGIIVVTVMLNELELSAAAQKARDAIDEAEAINRTVAKLIGLEPDELAKRVKDGVISKEQYLEYLNRAMATSDNASMNINVHEINLPSLLDKVADNIGKIAGQMVRDRTTPEGT